MSNRSISNALLASGLFALVGTGLAGTEPAAAAGAPAYRITARYPIGGHDGGYDYLKLDAATHRLFVAHATRVEVLDADTGKKVGEIADTPGVHGIALAPEFHHGFTSNGLGRSVTMFDLESLKTLAVIKYTGVKPDSIAYDPETRKIFVVNGGDTGDVSVIAPDTGAIIATVPLGGGKLEEIQLDGHGHGFVNDEANNAIHVFDTHGLTKLGTWPISPGEEPTGLAFDAQTHRLFAACANEKLVAVDSQSGKVLGTATIGSDPDGAAFDPKSRRVLVPSRDGKLSVVDVSGTDKFPTVQTLKTEPDVRTITLDERNGRAYLPSGRFGPAPKATAKDPNPRKVMDPQSFAVLVVGE
jgi:DNA-binding beta-propeller fold protein YncE